MNVYPNFTELYQKALVPIGEKDLNYLEEVGILNKDAFACTNWYIALEGNPIQSSSTYYQWRAIVYVSNSGSQIDFEQPFYTSEIIESFHDAYDYVRTIEYKARKDKLTKASSKKRKLMA